jgi:pimeloyl-ACP methyl ester carboxylesterase
LGRRIYDAGPADVRRAQIAHLQPKMVRAMGAEGTAILGDALASARSDPPRDIPVIVLSHGKADAIKMRDMDADEVEQGWQTLERELAASFEHGEYRQVEGAGHFIQTDRPDAVIQAIHDVLDAAASR